MNHIRNNEKDRRQRSNNLLRTVGTAAATALLVSSCSSGAAESNHENMQSHTADRKSTRTPVEYPWSDTIDNSPEATKRCNRPDDAPVLFTFDDSGSKEQIETLLETLKKENIKAAFFPIGEWAEKHLDLINDMKDEGHYVGDHTQTHANLGEFSLENPEQEAKFYQEIYPLKDVTNTSPMLLRPPFEGGAYLPKVEDALSEKGIQECTWTADSRDWDGSTADEMVERLKDGDKYTEKIKPHGVILMHMLGDHTAEAVPKIVDLLNEEKIPYEKLHE